MACPLVIPDTPGLYILLLALEAPMIVPSRLGPAKLEPGLYAYVGSAGGGLRGRLCRHIVSPRRLRWHVDLLTAHGHADLIAAAWFEGAWGVALEDMMASVICSSGGRIPAPGFGASDSRGGERLCGLEDCSVISSALSEFGGEWGCVVYASSSLWCRDPMDLVASCSQPRLSSAFTKR